MERKDYYKILGVDKNASDKEIKDSFRKLSLKYHPDRQSGKSDSEKKIAEEKFKEVSEAYDTLSDPKKKQAYDLGESGTGFDDFFRDMAGGFNPFTGHTDPFGFSDIFGGNQRRRNPTGERPEDLHGSDIRMNIPLNIEDIVNGCKKKVKYKRHVRCHSCHGKGGDKKITCPYCNGTGLETKTTMRSGMMFQTSTTCTHCGGKGYKIENPCHSCNSTGFEIKEEMLDISFQPGIGNNATMYTQKGNESKSEKGIAGNFIAVPVIDASKLGPKYTIEGLDIYETKKVKLTEALLGKEIEIQVPGRPVERYKLNPNTKPGDIIIKYGLGLLQEDFEYGRSKRGNYVFKIQYDLPSSLSSRQEVILEKLAETGM